MARQMAHDTRTLNLKQIKELQKKYGAIDKVDPGCEAYDMLIWYLDNCSMDLLKQLALADIKFVSALARNRLPKKAK